MREVDFEVLLRLVERLDGEQRAALGAGKRAAPLPLQGLPQDLQRAHRHLAGTAA